MQNDISAVTRFYFKNSAAFGFPKQSINPKENGRLRKLDITQIFSGDANRNQQLLVRFNSSTQKRKKKKTKSRNVPPEKQTLRNVNISFYLNVPNSTTPNLVQMLIYLSYNHDFVLQELNSKKQSQKWMETRFQENKS